MKLAWLAKQMATSDYGACYRPDCLQHSINKHFHHLQMANVGNVEEQALKRRERLKAMRNKQRDPQEGGEPPDKKVAALDDGEALPK